MRPNRETAANRSAPARRCWSRASSSRRPSAWAASLLAVELARRHHGLGQRDQPAVARGTVEAAAPPGVAGDAVLIDEQQHRVAIAIDAQLHQPLHLAGALALAPEFLARAGPVVHPTGPQRL